MITDAHMHICEQMSGSPSGQLLTSLTYGRAKSDDKVIQVLPPCFERTSSPVEMALVYMDWCQVDKAFLVQGMMYGYHNDYVAQAVYRWPDRFFGFAMVAPWLGKEAVQQLERALDMGLRALKVEVPSVESLHPQFSFKGDNEMLLWEACERLSVPLMLHLPYRPTIVRELEGLLDAFPKLVLIIAHMGSAPHEGWKDEVRLGKRGQVHFEISGLPARCAAEEYPYPTGQEAVKWAVAEIGAEKLMWGSDYPGILKFCTYPQSLNLIKTRCAFLSDHERALILGGNAERLIASLE